MASNERHTGNEKMTTKQIELDGIVYDILKELDYEFNGKTRREYFLKRPRGKRQYYAIRYENGVFSSVCN